jgi:hypothetical protein
MKPPFRNRFLQVLNTAALVAMNSASSLWHEMRVELPDGSTRARYQFVPYGEYPVKLPDGSTITQVVDREAATQMAANFGKLTSKLATFFKGIPIYEGHVDDPTWAKENPGYKTQAIGRIKSIEPGEDGIYVESVFNTEGVRLLTGEAPAYSGHSSNWRMVQVPGRPGCWRPIVLWSDALTNTPNIQECRMALNALDMGDLPEETESPAEGATAEGETENQETNDDMKLTAEALKALGFAPDATPSPEEISAAIVKMLGEKMAAETEKTTAEENLTTANSTITGLRSQIAGVLNPAVDLVITSALNSGRITAAEKDAWVTALNSDFTAELAKLNAKMPVINTSRTAPTLPRVDVAETVDAMNSAVREYAVEKAIDINTEAGWTRAFNECKAAKPDLFKRN